MSVVVTGGAGFIGANLVRHLTGSAGVDRVVVVDDLSSGSPGNLAGLDVDLRTGSILDPELLDAALAGADAVVHLAAVPSVPRSVADPMTSHHANATGTLEVLQAVRRAGGPYLVLASSSSVYGANPTLPKSEDLRPAPLSPYAVSKLAAEAYALAFASCATSQTVAMTNGLNRGPRSASGLFGTVNWSVSRARADAAGKTKANSTSV